MSGRLDLWFKQEILVHEDILMRFLARSWPNPHELADIRQEAYARVCEAARTARPQAPKAFLFSIARHIMADRRRRERIVSIQAASDQDFSNDLVEEKTPDRWVSAHQELARLVRAFDLLPAACRRVVWMRRVLDIPQKEVAERLSISLRTVESQMLKGTKLLATHFSSEAGEGSESPGDGAQRQDKEHKP